MPDRPEAYEILVRLDQKFDDFQIALIGEQGRIPKVETDITRIEGDVKAHAKQVHEWTGSLKMGAWIFGILLTLFGGVLVTHIMSEPNPHNVIVAPIPALDTGRSIRHSTEATSSPSRPQPQ
jgi:hypothetical protein